MYLCLNIYFVNNDLIYIFNSIYKFIHIFIQIKYNDIFIN